MSNILENSINGARDITFDSRTFKMYGEKLNNNKIVICRKFKIIC